MEKRSRRFSSREVLLIRQTLSLIGVEIGSDNKNGHFSGRSVKAHSASTKRSIRRSYRVRRTEVYGVVERLLKE